LGAPVTSSKPVNAVAGIPPRETGRRCQRANEVISLIGDKWSVHIVMLLGGGRQRFMEIKRAVDGISHKMLSVTLRGLERDGYLTRTVFPTIPPKVEYELTDLGRELLVPLTALGSWAIDNHHRVAAARTAYDLKEAGAAPAQTPQAERASG